ncbi:SDR family oxidoreductase [Pseudomonas syringae]|uniref:Short chain dehydrogenase/reductase family oxidoreductase n=1 Tax=Pseudomonas syringae pv. daphniphylli TaxID=264455 RepID=A0A9X0H203_PSESX|nr:SDR family oxidoreductase [Pseudomonas syringae]KPX09266.1 Uncharacterized protein ALO73_00827 [Pseudomonas syringae pv. daphniphylli]KWS85725.1 short-chain dehydrogenase [Pseudomonas syringae pv. daphniphylli]
MTVKKKIVLVTGANKGIGFEIATQLGRTGAIIYIGARDKLRGVEAVNRLRTEGIDARFTLLDVTDAATVQSTAEIVRDAHGVLDILVNNAGLIDPHDGPPSGIDLEVLRRTFETNFFGAALVAREMLPYLRESDAGRIVNISSGLGSLALNEDPSWAFADTKLIAYNASKAALNMLTVQLAWELRDTNIKVNSANPNFTETDLVPGVEGAQPVEAGAITAIELALLADNGPTGGFFERGEHLPW